MGTVSASTQPAQLAAQVRHRLVAQAVVAMDSLLGVVQERLTALMNEAAPSREMQMRRDAWMAFQRFKSRWRDGTVQAWQTTLLPVSRPAPITTDSTLSLLGTEVVENKIIASRMALDLMEKGAQDVNDLRKRLKSLNNDRELNSRDIVHPEVLMLPLVEQWDASGLSRESWQLVNPVVQRHFNEQLQKTYALCNEELVAQGVLPVIDFSPKHVSMPQESGAADAQAGTPPPNPTPESRGRRAEDRLAGGGGGNIGSPIGFGNPRLGRAQGILQQLGQLLGGVLGGGFAGQVQSPIGVARAGSTSPRFERAGAESVAYAGPSAPLMVALAQQPRLNEVYFSAEQGVYPSGYPVMIERVASELRQQSTELKGKAQTDDEKTIIELVALMFQSILQEDRIPTGVRVWFARLQMPVLRVALAEPDFFTRQDHPARQLIDHMGSCVLGFDASGISSAALETEIKRVVQVIEQYPDTGERVYKKVYEEFQAFLKQHLSTRPVTQKLMGVAEQLEQKETLTIQYTIEFRDQLKDMPVRDEVREFLFKVWAEVLAISAVRQGGQHEETLLLKKTATDLIWAASAKPNRTDRARVIADLPVLLQSLRTGMTLLGLARTVQEAHIKVISDTLADAFMSKTQAIADDQIQALAKRLAELEDYVSDDGGEELPLDSDNIEELLDIEANELDVVTTGGDHAGVVMLEWARELALGSWYTLTYKNQVSQVQYVWRSPLGHMHLFATNVGHSYLFQTVRLAAYLQAGSLEPQEDEPLMTRAARNALTQIESNPERLLK